MNGPKSDEIQTFEKYSAYYHDQVSYFEDPYFFSDWYGFMYYRNESEYRFRFDKQLQSCVGYKVVNGDFPPETKSSIVVLEPNEDRTYLVKRTRSQCKFLSSGKVLAPIAEDQQHMDAAKAR